MYLANPDLTYADRFHMPRFTNGAFHVCLAALYKVLRTRGWLACAVAALWCGHSAHVMVPWYRV